jgi:hypothetical protein
MAMSPKWVLKAKHTRKEDMMIGLALLALSKNDSSSGSNQGSVAGCSKEGG